MSPPNPLRQLHRLKASSPQFPAEIATILDGEEYKASVKTLQDKDLMWLVDFLDNVIGASTPTSLAFRTCLSELRRICGIRQTLPQSYTPPCFLLEVGDQPAVRGYYGDVHLGSLDGSTIRVKRLFSSDGAKQNSTKNFYEEAVAWKHLEHPNIVPILGITIAPSPPQLISDWISGGHLTEYIGGHQRADRLCLVSNIASGLEYLHSNNVVHGNLKGPNILVDDSGQARIADFGLAVIPQNQTAKRAFLDDQTARWTAPEILHDSGTYSKEADVFSFAMVMIEVFTGAVPFDTSLPNVAAVAIMQRIRPPRPTHPDCSNKLWALMQRYWDQESHMRPELSEVFQVLPSNALSKLRRLYQPGMASHEFQLTLGRFYGSTKYRDRVDSLHGADLKEFVDFLDNVLRTEGLDQGLLQQTLDNLRSVCSHHAVVPSTCVISDGLRKSMVAHIRVTKLEETQKELYGDVATWAWLDHPNVLQCFGITVNPFQVVTEWVPNGNVVEYLQTHLNADRVCLLMDVVRGLDYLHSYGVIHRNLKSQNVLVNAAGCACLSDIGFTTFVRDEELGVGDAGNIAHTSQWTAPEVFKNGKFSKQSDVFSFGFVAAEILTGQLLWGGVSAAEARSKIDDGERPRLPKGKVELGATSEMWGMLAKCWETEATERITISAVLSILQYMPQPISGTSYSLERATARSVRDPGQDFIDELDEILENNRVFDQERTSSMHATCWYNDQTAEDRHGGFANVFKGVDRGRPVAVKVVRLYLVSDLEMCLSMFCREAVAWKHLRHPNILPFLGVNLETHKYAMISEWMDNGNINEFIEKHREANRMQLLVDVASGLDYMHSLQFVHGDLKGANVLVTKDGRACLADFGLSTIVRVTHQATVNADSTSMVSSTSLMSFTAGGTPRWMSPELLYPERFGAKDSQPTTRSDCYALGMVVYEVLLGKAPYWEMGESMVVEAVITGVRPKKPHAADSLGFTDGVWWTVQRSWMVDAEARPDVKALLYHLSHAASTWSRRQPV